MTFETKRGYKVTRIGKDVIITAPTDEVAQQIYDSLYTECLIGKMRAWGLLKKR